MCLFEQVGVQVPLELVQVPLELVQVPLELVQMPLELVDLRATSTGVLALTYHPKR